jgi:hypothetical protein
VSKHTPGPWWVDGADLYRKDEINIKSVADHPNDERYVAAAIGGLNDGVQEANARLIAAAPDLLEALRIAEGLVDDTCFQQDPANECWNTLRTVRAAIAKATGAA